MKRRSTLTILFVIVFAQLWAQAPVALHHAGNTTLYYGSSGFADAYNNAVHGDTIYLPGGFYDGITINKSLKIIGAGHHPDSTAATNRTQINGIITLGQDADSVLLEGLYITNSIQASTNFKVDKLKIRRCYVAGTISLDGDGSTPSMYVEISGSVVIGELYLSNTHSALVTNNIFQGRVQNLKNAILANNIFMNTPYQGSPYWTTYAIIDVDNTHVRNNVFLDSDGITLLQCDNSTIEKNLFATSSVNYASCFDLGNYLNVGMSNVFVNATKGTFQYNYNFHLQSPSTYLGTDGTQVGIYGGIRPYKEGAVPFNPHIRFKNIASETNSSGQLPVVIKVAAQND